MVERLRAYIREAGRDESAVNLQARLTLARAAEETWPAYALGWQALGATRLDINTMGQGFSSVRQHLAALARAQQTVERALAGS
jgi:hypothetical protein